MSLNPYDETPEREAMEREREEWADELRDQRWRELKEEASEQRKRDDDNGVIEPDEPQPRNYDDAIHAIQRREREIRIRRNPSF